MVSWGTSTRSWSIFSHSAAINASRSLTLLTETKIECIFDTPGDEHQRGSHARSNTGNSVLPMKGDIMPRPPKLPFDALPGLPSQVDEEVMALMEAVDRLPREGANQVARCLLRAALGYERAGDAGYLTCLAENILLTMRWRSHPKSKNAFDDKLGIPARAEVAADLEETGAR